MLMRISYIMGTIIVIWYLMVVYYTNQVAKRKTYTIESILERLEEKKIICKEYIDLMHMEEINLTSNDGFKLRGNYIPGKGSDTIIFCHGMSMAAENSFKYCNMFINRGWNVLIFHMRRHGESEGKYSTLGKLEKDDLDLFVDWVIKIKGKDGLLGIHGESMGAATSLLYLDINKYVDFIIADCPYSNLNELLRLRIKEDTIIPGFLIYNPSRYLSKVVAKFDYNEIKPIDSVSNSKTPILFIHGEDDEFVPTYMSKNMYDKKTGIKGLYIVKGAKHAQSYSKDPKEYEKVVFQFIEGIKGIGCKNIKK
jgi:fermentation-respiration switch protein FrsA (DUF1100 family)